MKPRMGSAAAVAGLVLLASCSVRDAACGRGGSAPAVPQTLPQIPSSAAAKPAGNDTVRIVFLGDSLTAGYGLTVDQAYPAIVEQKFRDEGYREVEVVNAGVTGDTTASGLRRLEPLLEPGVRVLVVALGGNDALRGLTPAQTHDSLAQIIDLALSKDVLVLVAGMEAPTNLGQDYQTAFSAAFADIARAYKDRIAYMPFLLEGVAGNPALNQADGIHPNEAGARLVADTVYPKLRTLVDQIVGSSGG